MSVRLPGLQQLSLGMTAEEEEDRAVQEAMERSKQEAELQEAPKLPASAEPLPPNRLGRLVKDVNNPLESDLKTPMKNVTVELEDLPTGVDATGLYSKQVVYTVGSPGESSYQIAARFPSGWPIKAPRYYIKTTKTGPKVTEDGDVWWKKGDWVDCKTYVVVITREGEPLHHLAPPLGWDDTKYAWLHEVLLNWAPALNTSYYVSLLKTDEVIDSVLQEA